MLVSSTVHQTLGLKDRRVVSVEFTVNELRTELDGKEGRKLRCSICSKRIVPEDTLRERR